MTRNTLLHSMTCHVISPQPDYLHSSLHPSALGLAHSRHFINFSWLTDATSTDSSLSGNKALRLNTDLSQVGRWGQWSLLFCSLYGQREAGSFPRLVHCLYLYNCSVGSLCQWVRVWVTICPWLLYTSSQPGRFRRGFPESWLSTYL